MTRRSKIWLIVAVLFSLINLAGAGVAAAQVELIHALTHVVLALLGAYVVWRLIPMRSVRRAERPGEATMPAIRSELADRLTHLEQAVDAIAIEVERIGEGQRFLTRSFTENAPTRKAGEGAAKPVEHKAPEAQPQYRRD